MEFFRQEHWSGHSLLQWDLPDLGIKPKPPELQVDTLLSEPTMEAYQYAPM